MKRIALRHLAKTDHRIYSKMIHMRLLDVRNPTVDLPTAAGWIRPVNDVSFQLGPAESLVWSANRAAAKPCSRWR